MNIIFFKLRPFGPTITNRRHSAHVAARSDTTKARGEQVMGTEKHISTEEIVPMPSYLDD